MGPVGWAASSRAPKTKAQSVWRSPGRIWNGSMRAVRTRFTGGKLKQKACCFPSHRLRRRQNSAFSQSLLSPTFSAWILPGDVILQLIDGEVLRGNRSEEHTSELQS